MLASRDYKEKPRGWRWGQKHTPTSFLLFRHVRLVWCGFKTGLQILGHIERWNLIPLSFNMGWP